MASLASLPLASTAAAPSPTPPPSSDMPAIDTLLLHQDFNRLDQAVDDATRTISQLLAELVSASRARVECVAHLDELRVERQRLVDEELSAQHRSRDLLDEARHEMACQEAWSAEIRELYLRAEMDGVDIAATSLEQLDAEMERRASGKGKDRETRSVEEVEMDERAEVFGRQLLYLTHSTQKSESRVRAILHSLQSSRTTRVSQLALNQLHTLARRYSTQLESLAVDRERLTGELRVKEGERDGLEERREEVVLDIVLEWDEQRRWRKEERRRRREEGYGSSLSGVLRELEGVASLLPQLSIR
ncbi:hypothetical protein JCM6882_008781 [Rhodosporidiobolus microsporus]